ncbi:MULTISPECIES: DUF4349 domain-containing protein [unclassified Paenibacillus]|uniref:DUF4349 domain-containing protein n=1 Tax=unclassified Paenibacillus TaxID=185978 RepID=UPI0003E283FF|nr:MULTISPECIES: DUF4349 domain-containing protein [unclassified Paenibacillus]ETT44322.1 hypothetical protein C162_24060 [Paenibacillus sp. FSL R7-269]OMF99855.1 hypothetical protein BK147_05885 [Paenibacillus sp. FSL R7-0337]
MRKWGLHYLLYLVVVALVLAGCGASSNNSDSAANTESAFRNEAASDGSAESAPAAVEGKKDSLANTAMAVNDQAAVKGGGGNSALPGTDAGQGADASAGFTGTDVVAGLNKKLIYKANLNMEVSDYGAAQTEVRNMVTLAGGYIIEFSENMSEYEQGGTFILKVPAAGFSPFLNNLEKIKHEKLQRSIQGQDVSEEYVDLESRLKAKQMMEAQYIDFMKKATKPADLVQFANQLGEIQEQIEQIKGRMRYIDQNVSFSTVELRLYQTEKSLALTQTNSEGPLGERASEALKSSMKALSVMFQWLVVVLAAALPVLLVAGVVVALVLWLRKSFKRRQPAHPEQARLGSNRLPDREAQPHSEAAPLAPAAPEEENTDKQNK